MHDQTQMRGEGSLYSYYIHGSIHCVLLHTSQIFAIFLNMAIPDSLQVYWWYRSKDTGIKHAHPIYNATIMDRKNTRSVSETLAGLIDHLKCVSIQTVLSFTNLSMYSSDSWKMKLLRWVMVTWQFLWKISNKKGLENFLAFLSAQLALFAKLRNI